MNSYQSKLATFISHGNTIILNNDTELNELRERMHSIGITFLGDFTFAQLVENVKLNVERKHQTCLEDKLIVEFENGKGVSIGWDSVKESEDWFGEKPYTWDEVKAEL